MMNKRATRKCSLLFSFSFFFFLRSLPPPLIFSLVSKSLGKIGDSIFFSISLSHTCTQFLSNSQVRTITYFLALFEDCVDDQGDSTPQDIVRKCKPNMQQLCHKERREEMKIYSKGYILPISLPTFIDPSKKWSELRKSQPFFSCYKFVSCQTH